MFPSKIEEILKKGVKEKIIFIMMQHYLMHTEPQPNQACKHHPKPEHVWHYILGGGWCLAGPPAALSPVPGRLYNAGQGRQPSNQFAVTARQEAGLSQVGGWQA